MGVQFRGEGMLLPLAPSASSSAQGVLRACSSPRCAGEHKVTRAACEWWVWQGHSAVAGGGITRFARCPASGRGHTKASSCVLSWQVRDKDPASSRCCVGHTVCLVSVTGPFWGVKQNPGRRA